LRQVQRRGETLDIPRRLAQGGDQRVARLVFGGGERGAAMGGRRDGLAKRCLQHRQTDDIYRQVGKQRVVRETGDHQDGEAVQFRVGISRKGERYPDYVFHLAPCFPRPKMIHQT